MTVVSESIHQSTDDDSSRVLSISASSVENGGLESAAFSEEQRGALTQESDPEPQMTSSRSYAEFLSGIFGQIDEPSEPELSTASPSPQASGIPAAPIAAPTPQGVLATPVRDDSAQAPAAQADPDPEAAAAGASSAHPQEDQTSPELDSDQPRSFMRSRLGRLAVITVVAVASAFAGFGIRGWVSNSATDESGAGDESAALVGDSPSDSPETPSVGDGEASLLPDVDGEVVPEESIIPVIPPAEIEEDTEPVESEAGSEQSEPADVLIDGPIEGEVLDTDPQTAVNSVVLPVTDLADGSAAESAAEDLIAEVPDQIVGTESLEGEPEEVLAGETPAAAEAVSAEGTEAQSPEELIHEEVADLAAPIEAAQDAPEIISDTDEQVVTEPEEIESRELIGGGTDIEAEIGSESLGVTSENDLAIEDFTPEVITEGEPTPEAFPEDEAVAELSVMPQATSATDGLEVEDFAPASSEQDSMVAPIVPVLQPETSSGDSSLDALEVDDFSPVEESMEGSPTSGLTMESFAPEVVPGEEAVELTGEVALGVSIREIPVENGTPFTPSVPGHTSDVSDDLSLHSFAPVEPMSPVVGEISPAPISPTPSPLEGLNRNDFAPEPVEFVEERSSAIVEDISGGESGAMSSALEGLRSEDFLPAEETTTEMQPVDNSAPPVRWEELVSSDFAPVAEAVEEERPTLGFQDFAPGTASPADTAVELTVDSFAPVGEAPEARRDLSQMGYRLEDFTPTAASSGPAQRLIFSDDVNRGVSEQVGFARFIPRQIVGSRPTAERTTPFQDDLQGVGIEQFQPITGLIDDDELSPFEVASANNSKAKK